MPLGYEIFAGNRNDATTLEEMVEHVEGLYGRASRIWVMDRGMAGEDNVKFLRDGGRRYIVGTAKNSLRKFERELLAEDWRLVHEGLEVRITPAPERGAAGQRAGHARALREADRRGLGEDPCQLPEEETEAGDHRDAGRPAAGAEYASGRVVRCAGGSRRRRLGSSAVVEVGSLARVGTVE